MSNHGRFRLLLETVLLLVLVGCGQRTKVAGMQEAAAPPLAAGEKTVKREEWVSEPLKFGQATEVQVSASVASGPSVDMYVLTEAGFSQWNTLVSSGPQTGDAIFESVPMLGLEGLSAPFTSEWTVLAPGTYFLVFDNSSHGGTAPPSPGSDDVARVSFTISSRTPPK